MKRDKSRPVSRTDRRTFLKVTGTGALAATGLAGCVGTEDGGDGGDGGDGSDGGDGGDGGDGSDGSDGGDGGDGGDGEDGGATDTPTGPDTVVIGQPASLTGQWDFLQPAVSQAGDLAAQEINDAGGPLGATFELERRDTAVNPQNARQAFRQFVNNDNAVAINGLFSSEIQPMWDFIQEQQVPVVTPWPGSRFLDTRGGDKGTPEDLSDDGWLWRTVIGDTVHTAGAAQAMVDNDFGTMGVLNGTGAGESGYADSFIETYEGLGGTIAQRVEVQEGSTSYQSQIDRLFEADFDAWLLALALEDATTAIQNWSQGGYGRQLLLEDGLMSEDLISAVGEEAEGGWIAAGSTQGPNYDSFESKFKEAGDADIHTWGVASYDATNVLALAIHRAGEASHDAIQQNIGPVAREGGTTVSTFAEGKEALDNGEEINYEGAVTNVDFTQHGNVWGDVAVSQISPDGFNEQFSIGADTLQENISEY
jgi:ABC-type branched-subunit amino acid transport system substrate-binding protein